MPPTVPDASNDRELRERIMEAMLLAGGELGYREVSVENLVEHYGGDRVHFYAHFASLDECFAAAYEWQAERLAAEILTAAASAGSWARGLRAALDVFAAFVSARPLTARALLVEVHVAGAPALRKRKEVFERLMQALDSARREADPRHSPPPSTALFMLSAIEAAAVSALSSGRPDALAEAVPDLSRLILTAYFGDESRGDA